MNNTCPLRSFLRSAARGSFTFTISSASLKIRSGPSKRPARGAIVIVAETGASASAAFNQHRVSAVDEFRNRRRDEPYTILVVLYFLRNADLHGSPGR